MINLFSWINKKTQSTTAFLAETISNAQQYVYDSYTQIQLAADFIYTNSPSPYQFVNFTQLWEGLSTICDPSLLPKMWKSPKTLSVLWQSFTETVYFGSMIVIYECGMKPALRTIPFYEDSYAETALIWTTNIYFLRKSWRIYVDTVIRNAALMKAATEENPFKHVPCICGEDSIAVTRGNIESLFYYGGKIGTAKIAAKFIPIVGDLILIQALGECFLEYPLDKMCTQHRFEEIAKNNWRAFGMGLSFFLLQQFFTNSLEYGAKSFTGFLGYDADIKNSYLNDAIFGLLFQYFIMLSLYIDKPYSGKEAGVEFFFDGRGLVERRMKQGTDWILKNLKNSSAQNLILPVYQAINTFTLTHWIKKLFLEEDYRSLSKFVKTKAMIKFLELRGDEIHQFLEWLIYVRKIPLAKRLAFVWNYVPSFLLSKEVKKVINLILQKRLDGLIEMVRDFIDIARIQIHIIDPQALQRIAKQTFPVETSKPQPMIESKPLTTPLIFMNEKELEKSNQEQPLNHLIIDDYFSYKDKLQSSDVTLEKPNVSFDFAIIDDYEPPRHVDDSLVTDWVYVPPKIKQSELRENSLFASKKTPANKSTMHIENNKFMLAQTEKAAISSNDRKRFDHH